MPKYGFHVGSTFNPTSVEDYLRPGLAYVQTFKDYQNQYQALMDNTADLKKLAEMEGSVEAYATYDKYQKALTEAANNLATMGWSRDRDIKSAMDLRRQFTEDIVPIKEAYNTWKSMADEQRKNNPKGDLVYDTDFSNAGVDFFLKNPNPTYKAVSQAELEDTGFKEGKAYASRLPITLQQAQAFGSQYLEMRRLGASTQDALATLSNGDSELSQIVQQVYDSYGLNDNNNYTDTQKEQLRDRIITGVLEGIIDDASLVSNKNWDLYEANYKKQLTGSSTDDGLQVLSYRVLGKNKDGKDVYIAINPDTGEYTYDDVPGSRESDVQTETYTDENGIERTVPKLQRDSSGQPVMYNLYAAQNKNGKDYVTNNSYTRVPILDENNNIVTYDKNDDINPVTGRKRKKPSTALLSKNAVIITVRGGDKKGSVRVVEKSKDLKKTHGWIFKRDEHPIITSYEDLTSGKLDDVITNNNETSTNLTLQTMNEESEDVKKYIKSQIGDANPHDFEYYMYYNSDMSEYEIAIVPKSSTKSTQASSVTQPSE